MITEDLKSQGIKAILVMLNSSGNLWRTGTCRTLDAMGQFCGSFFVACASSRKGIKHLSKEVEFVLRLLSFTSQLW